jgi:ubiquinone/menaquinone biosynthesis C-methylase UbiE
MESQGRPLHAEVARVTVKPGMTILDIGCGSGQLLQIAAAGLLAVARERLPSGDLCEGEMTALPWPDHTFDLVPDFNSFRLQLIPVRA